jgi:mannosyltransferase OCH1-like enzyme
MTEVNSFWHGAELTVLEVLCISSFLKNGVTYNLYAYELPANLPKGVVLKDANEIVDRSRMFTYQAGTFNLGSVAGFANLFRYSLIHERGGWWADTDVCYVNGLSEESSQMFFAEPSPDGAFFVGNTFFKSPRASPVLRYCLDRLAEKDLTRIIHGETGPLLITAAIRACETEDAVLGSPFPVPYWEYERLFFDESLVIEPCVAVHFWNAMLRSAQFDKNGKFPENSVFERLKRKYLSVAVSTTESSR